MNEKHISLMFSEEWAHRVAAAIGSEYEVVLDRGEELSIRDAIYRAAVSARVREANEPK